jgi:hypothetical protein
VRAIVVHIRLELSRIVVGWLDMESNAWTVLLVRVVDPAHSLHIWLLGFEVKFDLNLRWRNSFFCAKLGEELGDLGLMEPEGVQLFGCPSTV